MNAHLGDGRALIVTAIPLREKEVERISEWIAHGWGRTYVLDLEVNPEVLGGLRVRIGDTLIDWTVRARLDSLREFLKRNLR
jgi:F-type H+-transporting ATPase subunit delta